MPVSAGTAYVDILAKLDKLGAQVTSGVSKSVGEAESKLASRFSTFGKNMGRNLLAGVGITFAAAGLIKFIGSSVQAAQEAEQSQLRLNQAFKIFPALANVNIESLRKLNTQMSFKTKFDDDALASGQAVLAQFKLTGQQIQEITPLLADYAAKTGMDIPSAATALGRAFLGNTRALKTIGINFKATGDIAKDYTNIVGLLRQKVGGFAEAEGKTFSGRLEILKTQFGEVKESIGRAVLPILSGLAKIVVQDVIPRLGQFAALLKETFGPLFSSIVSTARAFLPILKDVGTVIGISLIGALKLLALILKPLAPVISGVGAALVTAFVATKITAGIQAMITAIGALIARMAAFGAVSVAPLAATAAAATAAVGAEQAFGASVLASLAPLQAQAASTGAVAAATGALKASLLAAIGPMLVLTGAVVAIVASYKVIRHAQELVKAGNKATADSFIKETIPALLKTGGALTITASQWRAGPFGGSDISKTRKVFDELSRGVITTSEAFRRLKDIAGVTQSAIDAVVTSQLRTLVSDAKITGDLQGVGIALITAFRAAGTATTTLGQTLHGLSSRDLYALQQQLTKAGIPAEALATIFQTATGKAYDLAGAANQVADAMQNASAKVLGMSRTDLTNWEKQTTSNMHFVNASLSDLAGQANLTATEILRSFDKQLRALADYNRNFQRLINRNVPSDLLKQLADMGQQGAGIVAALATANEKDFQRILRDWRNGRLAARGVANEVEGMATRINKATASIVSRRRTFLLDLVVTPSLQRIIEQSGRGTVLKGELLRFQEGGMVPGPVGVPQLAVVHGGERVLTPNQQIQNTTGDTYNVNISTSDKKVVEDLGAFLRRRQLLRTT